jgi:hypothetical protein
VDLKGRANVGSGAYSGGDSRSVSQGGYVRVYAD